MSQMYEAVSTTHHSAPAKAAMYRFPWSLTDNPIGWVEITDSCNISCHGCYRLRLDGHKPFDAICDEIRWMHVHRNAHNLTLAGGEPLIHPRIVDIVKFGADLGLVPCVVSNGQALDEGLLVRLRDAGLAEISFHIDSGQTRKGIKAGGSEAGLNALRQARCDLVSRVGGVRANFNMTVSRRNLHEVPDVLRWALGTRGQATGITLITLRGANKDGFEYRANGETLSLRSNRDGIVQDVAPEHLELKSTDLYRVIKETIPEYVPSAYLGGTRTHTSLKWLVAQLVCVDGRPIGSIGPASMELAQTAHHMLKGRYTAGGRGTSFGRGVLLAGLVDPQVRSVARTLLRRPSRLLGNMHGFSVAIVQPPDILPDGSVDMCDSCPDLTLWEGELVNSCRLEEYRRYGALLESTPAEEA